MTNEELFQEDVLLILEVLGLGTHARPYSTHEVILREIIPAIKKSKGG